MKRLNSSGDDHRLVSGRGAQPLLPASHSPAPEAWTFGRACQVLPIFSLSSMDRWTSCEICVWPWPIQEFSCLTVKPTSPVTFLQMPISHGFLNLLFNIQLVEPSGTKGLKNYIFNIVMKPTVLKLLAPYLSLHKLILCRLYTVRTKGISYL